MVNHRSITPPKVSILLPNLNNREYLEERLDSILKQTFTGWELIIVDNYSDDGAWDFFNRISGSDSRIHISQAPRTGMYANWNNCIELATGEFVYIATSDDTMTPDCLELMVQALESYPECDIAHCCLTIIDKNGRPSSKQWSQWENVLFYGDFINQKHIRKAPYDGYIHAGWKAIYSITQLLIRRSLFTKIGLFRNDFGSIADFEWEMRATLVANVIHIPKYLATWRVYSGQATQHEYLQTADFSRKLIDMVDFAFKNVESLGKQLPSEDLSALQYVYRRQLIGRRWRETPSLVDKLSWIQKNLRKYPKETLEVVISKLSARKLCKLEIDKYINTMLKTRKLTENIIPVA